MNEFIPSHLPSSYKKFGIFLIVWLLAAGLLLSTGLVLAAPENAILDVEPSQTDIAVGENVIVTVTLTTLDAEPFGTWKVHLDYDDAVLQLGSVVVNESVVPPFLDAVITLAPGSIIVTDGHVTSNNSGSSTPYILLTATFTATAVGGSNFTVITDTVFPQNETNYGDVVAGDYWIPGERNVQQVTVSSPSAVTLAAVSATPAAGHYAFILPLAACLLLTVVYWGVRRKRAADL